MRNCLTRNPNWRREPAGPAVRTKRANANFGPRDFPRRSAESEEDEGRGQYSKNGKWARSWVTLGWREERDAV